MEIHTFCLLSARRAIGLLTVGPLTVGLLAAGLPGAQAQVGPPSSQTSPLSPHGPAWPVTPAQRAQARQVAQAGVPLADLTPGAPERYTVQRGDTLWAIAGLYLRSPWRWPQLWGMNMAEITNPHRIFPGQVLELVREGGLARLRLAGRSPGAESEPTTVKLEPRVRGEALPDLALPTLRPGLIEPFLADPLVVSEAELARAPRLVAASDSRVLLTRGDRAYARGPQGAPLVGPEGSGDAHARAAAAEAAGSPVNASVRDWVVVRSPRPLHDPVTGQVLGVEVQTVGRARLLRGESAQAQPPVPASMDIVAAKQELRAGDRLLPAPARQFVSYAPRAPEVPITGAQVLAIYGDTVATVGQNQVVALNKGTDDGLASGHVLAILQEGRRITDTSGEGRPQTMQLPAERNGLLMVFRSFAQVSYALVLETRQGVKVGDRLVAPR